jgi:hypothetical protein
MRRTSILLVIFVLQVNNSAACHIDFDQLDSTDVIRHIYERSIVNITGQLRDCPSSLIVRNISIANPSLKRLSILNVTYIMETGSMNIHALARLIGFAPLTIQLYFEDRIEHR